MNGALTIAEVGEYVINGMTAFGSVNDAKNRVEMVSSLDQIIGFFGAITLSPERANVETANVLS